MRSNSLRRARVRGACASTVNMEGLTSQSSVKGKVTYRRSACYYITMGLLVTRASQYSILDHTPCGLEEGARP